MLFLQGQYPDLLEPQQIRISDNDIKEAVQKIEADKPSDLFIFSHFNLIPEDDYANQQKAQYAGHYVNGLQLLEMLKDTVSGKIIIFCGHQHWHHIVCDSDVVQCTNAAMIEYPMEAKIISVDNSQVHISTLASTSPEISNMSLDKFEWVCGQDFDRNMTLAMKKK